MGKKNNKVQNEKVSNNENSELINEKVEEEVNEEKIKQEDNEAKKAMENLQRIMADFDNYKKRTMKEKESLYADITADIVTDFLTVIDNIDKAVDNIKDDLSFKEGILLIRKQFIDVLSKYNVKEIEALNSTFDPNLHESVQHIDDEKYGEKEIVEVFRKGYILGNKVLRYAMVKVAN